MQPGNIPCASYGSNSVFTPEITTTSYTYNKPELVLPAPKFPAYASEYEIIRSAPALPVFTQELSFPAPSLPSFVSELAYNRPSLPSLPSFIPELAYTRPSLPSLPSLPSFIPELAYTRPSLPALPSLPVYAPEVIVPSRPAILPTPGYPIYDGLNDLLITGDLPVAGTASVNGAVPVAGALQFSGYVPAAGSVSVSCGCGNYPSVGIYY